MSTSEIIIAVICAVYVFVRGHYWLMSEGGSRTRFVQWLVRLRAQHDWKKLMKLQDFWKGIDSSGLLKAPKTFTYSVEKLYFQLWQELLALAAGACFASLAGLVFTWLLLAFGSLGIITSLGIALVGGTIFALTAYVQWNWIRNLS